MDPYYPNYCLCSEYPDSFQNYPNTQYENSQLPSSDNEVIPENVQTSQRGAKVDSRDTREDMVLMAAWIFVSEDAARGKNQRKGRLWSLVKNSMMLREQKVQKD